MAAPASSSESSPPPTRRTSLRTTLAWAVLGPLLAAVLLLGLVMALGRERVLDAHARGLLDQSVNYARSSVEAVIDKVQAFDRALHAMVARTPMTREALETAMLDQLDSFRASKDLAYIGIGLESNGAYIMLERRPDDSIRALSIWRDTNGIVTQREAETTGDVMGPFREVAWDGYDPRTRPHYVLAKEAGGPVWTDSYPFWKGNVRGEIPGITYATPFWRHGELGGVVDVDFELEGLGAFLARIHRSAQATPFLLETRRDGTTSVLSRGSPSADAAIAALCDDTGNVEKMNSATSFDVEGRAHIGTVAPLTIEGGPDWTVGIVIPRDVLAAPFASTFRWVSIIAIAAAIVATVLALRLSGRVARPLTDLAERLAAGVAPRGDDRSDLAETAAVTEAYRTMAGRVALRQESLEGANQVLLTEVAQRREVEERLRVREARLAAVTNALIDLAHNRVLLTADLDSALPEAARIGAEMLDVARVSIWFYDEAGTTIHCVELYERDAKRHSRGATLTANDHPDYFRALEAERLVPAHDARTDPRTRSFAVGYLEVLGITSLLDASLRRGERLVGVACFEHIGPSRTWSSEDLLFADGFADLLMVAIESNERRRAERELRDLNVSLEERVRDRTRDLAAANERLAELDRVKSQFLATTSHELRTPLNSIIGFTSIVKSGVAGPVNDEQRRQLEIVHSSARHLLGLINDLLDLSRIESGRMSVLWERVAPADVIDDVSKSLAPLVDAKHLTWDVVIDDRNAVIESDRKKLLQVLLNLGGNAVKFTEKGAIRIRAGLDCSVAPPRYRISVSDSGIGIPPEHIPLLFRPFAQLDAPARRALEGTGLGLYLSKQILGLLGGTIAVSSEPGQGSTFVIVVPTVRTDSPDTATPTNEV